MYTSSCKYKLQAMKQPFTAISIFCVLCAHIIVRDNIGFRERGNVSHNIRSTRVLALVLSDTRCEANIFARARARARKQSRKARNRARSLLPVESRARVSIRTKRTTERLRSGNFPGAFVAQNSPHVTHTKDDALLLYKAASSQNDR